MDSPRKTFGRLKGRLAPSRDASAPDLTHLVAARTDWPDGAPGPRICRIVTRWVEESPDGTVVVAGSAAARIWADVLRTAWPALTVLVVDAAAPVLDAHRELTESGPVDLVLDASDTSAEVQVRLLRQTFHHLRVGGHYAVYRMLVAEGAEDLWTLVSAAQAARLRDVPGPTDHTTWLGRCLRSVEVRGETLLLANRLVVRATVREEHASELLAARPELGAVVAGRAGGTLESGATYADNAEVGDPHRLQAFEAPPLALRRYDAPTCSYGQVVGTAQVLLPDTYRHNQQEQLVNIYVDEVAPLFGRIRRSFQHRQDLPGAYFHLDSEWPGHFGHLLTEQISRLWAYDEARRLEPDLKVLLSLPPERTSRRLEPFELEVLATYGITADDVVVLDQPSRVERLYAATPMFACPDRGLDEVGAPYVHPGITEVWTRIGDLLAAQAPDREHLKRIFCSRRPSLKRACHNVDEVEALFVAHGFTVIHPEDHPVAEQVAMFRAAEVVAGFAGSGLFTLAFCQRPVQVIALAPDSYTGRNEYPISAVLGHHLTMVWSRADEAHPDEAWSPTAFASGFTFDLEREGRYLADVLAGLDRTGPAAGSNPTRS